MKDLWLILANIALPLCAGITFFALARYSSHIAPMRILVTGEKTYKGAAWGFAFFGAYLITRPMQILMGPHPMPLVINCVREFCMMALFAPAVFVAMMSLCFGSDRIPRKLTYGIFALGFVLALTFVVLNVRAIGGSQEIFRLGSYVAYDGIWFKAEDAHSEALMSILFVIRFIDPLFLLALGRRCGLPARASLPRRKRRSLRQHAQETFFSFRRGLCLSGFDAHHRHSCPIL